MKYHYRLYKEHNWCENKKTVVAELNENQVMRISKFVKAYKLPFEMGLHLAINLGLSELRITHGTSRLDKKCTKEAVLTLVKNLEKQMEVPNVT